MLATIYSKLKILILGDEKPDASSIQFWREQVFLVISIGVLIFGTLSYIFSSMACFHEKLLFIWIFDSIIYLFAMMLVFNTRISFKKRVYADLFILYLISVMMLITMGKHGAGHLWLFAFSAMTTIMVGLRAATLSIVINFFTLLIMGISIVYLDLLPSSLLTEYNVISWTAISFIFILLNVIITLPTGMILKGLAEEINQKNQLQQQLYHAQKMEAIGTLAGGVAHDLNNVLSAQIGYPDLILLDLPNNSPLREPILKIQESGQKAAAIVQDLLTMVGQSLSQHRINVLKNH